jgi:hypothetical protein
VISKKDKFITIFGGLPNILKARMRFQEIHARFNSYNKR